MTWIDYFAFLKYLCSEMYKELVKFISKLITYIFNTLDNIITLWSLLIIMYVTIFIVIGEIFNILNFCGLHLCVDSEETYKSSFFGSILPFYYSTNTYCKCTDDKIVNCTNNGYIYVLPTGFIYSLIIIIIWGTVETIYKLIYNVIMTSNDFLSSRWIIFMSKKMEQEKKQNNDEYEFNNIKPNDIENNDIVMNDYHIVS
jgi:hypothetical protein